ncbi:MAG: class I SAM-dependent methyltransferase [Rhodospirillales bacterium]|nr:class I SAM-dependent methyltransferase [Rhodospirillales bacterium]
MFGPVYRGFYRLSKRFSRAGLYEWLDGQIVALNAAPKDALIRILNVGAGGEIAMRLQALSGVDLVQIDIDPARAPDIVADVCDLSMMQAGSFDAVFMLEVLEHVKTPQAALDEIYRVLKPGGALFLSTPFIFPLHDEPYDFYRYTKYGLAHLLAAFGDVKISERNDFFQSIMVLFARAMITSDSRNRIVGMGLFALALVFYPVLWGAARLSRNMKATTGYVVTAAK